MIDTGLYIHIPFCEKKCKYCNFYSIKATDDIIDTYVDVLCEELSLISEKNKEIILKTIYIGGGTPSLLNQNQLDKIFNIIKKRGGCVVRHALLCLLCIFLVLITLIKTAKTKKRSGKTINFPNLLIFSILN